MLFTWLGAIKYAAHRNLVDFGIFAQTAASAFGCFCNPLEGSHWAFHFSPILYLAGIAVALVHVPLTLIALQAVAGALCAPPIYGVVRARGDVARGPPGRVRGFALPAAGGSHVRRFHENGFAPAAVAWILYCFDAEGCCCGRRLRAQRLAVKEDQAIFLAIAGGGRLRFRVTMPGRSRFGAGAVARSRGIDFFSSVNRTRKYGVNPAWQPTRFYAWTAQTCATRLGPGSRRAPAFWCCILAPLRSSRCARA